MIGWKSGFDGGDSQEFEVEYLIVDPYTGQLNSVLNKDEFINNFLFDHNNATSMTFYGVS